jgi:serine/threonine protein kinase
MYKEAVSRMSESWKNWEGQVVDGRFPLRHYLGGRTRTAVFSTTAEGDASRKQAIRIVVADAQEAQALIDVWTQASKLSHPSLLRIVQMGRSRLGSVDLAYVVMEYVDEDLSQVLPDRPLSTAETREVLEATLEVLVYLHSKGFVHGRIKPSNIMAVNNQLKLSSDGLFRVGERRPATLNATPYDAPETFREPLQPAADFWSLGATLVQTLTQILPSFDRNKQTDPSLQKLPAPFSEIARHCLMTDSRLRWGATEIQQHLRHTAAAPEIADSASKRVADSHTNAVPRRLPRKWIAAAVGVVALLLIALLFRKPHTSASDTADPIHTTVESGHAGTPPMVNASDQPSPRSSAESNSVTPPPSRELPKPAAGATKAGADSVDASSPDFPGVIKKVVPKAPQSARDTITGTIRVGVHVKADTDGNVVDTELATPGPSRYFAGLATKAAEQWKFASASEGVAPREWLLHFEFRRNGTSVHPEPVH